MYNLKIAVNPKKVKSNDSKEVSISPDKYYPVECVKAAINLKGCDEGNCKYYFADDNGNPVYVYKEWVVGRSND